MLWLHALEKVPWPVWVLVTIAVLGAGWSAWSKYQADCYDTSWTDDHQPPPGIVVPPVTMIRMGGGGTSHGSGYPSPCMRTRCYPDTLASWEDSWIRADFCTPGVN